MVKFKDTYIVKCKALKDKGIELNPMFPDLEELIEMCRNLPKYKEVNDINLLSKMRVTISSSCCNSYLHNLSMNDFWLIFYIKMKYDLKWFPGDNIWK